MPNIPHAPLHTHHSSYNHTQPKQIIQEQTDIQSQHCLAQPLAQAEGPRSGEASSLGRIPLRLGEGSNKSKKASRDLAQAGSRHRTAEYHNSRRRSQSWKNEQGVFTTEALTLLTTKVPGNYRSSGTLAERSVRPRGVTASSAR